MVQSLLVTESALLLLWTKKLIFSFESHSCNSEGCPDPNVQSVLLEFSPFTILDNFVLKYTEETLNNSACLEYDIPYIQAEVANNVISSNQSVKINGVSHNNAEIPSYLQIKLSFMKQLTNKNSKSLENQFQELINKIWSKVKLLESNLQVAVSLRSVFQQLKVCKFGNPRIWIISLTNAIS